MFHALVRKLLIALTVFVNVFFIPFHIDEKNELIRFQTFWIVDVMLFQAEDRNLDMAFTTVRNVFVMLFQIVVKNLLTEVHTFCAVFRILSQVEESQSVIPPQTSSIFALIPSSFPPVMLLTASKPTV